MENNFKNDKTGEEFQILNFRRSFRNGEIVYTDKSGNILSDKGVTLTKIKGKIQAPSIQTDTKNRY
ncbi:MAG TPA: hypothetical protein DCW83_10525 [Saprospirales bacterium]|nr:hypothetical protein [Saprospirales bacterium]